MVNPQATEMPQPEQVSESRLPPLDSGDQLSRHEFERRYEAMPNVRKAELIEGIVYVASPLRYRSHARPHGRLIVWLGTYELSTLGVELGIEPTVRLDADNEPQPDGVLLIPEGVGGQSRLTEDDYVEGLPELVVEIAASSAAKDLHDKKNAYCRNGVREYIVWQTFENRLDWFYLQEGEYVSLAADENGVVRSPVFPGLWLSVPNLLAGNMTGVMSVLQEGLNSEEHHEFVQRLSEQ